MNFKRIHAGDNNRLVGLRCTSCSALVSRYFLSQHRCPIESLALKRLRCWESVFPTAQEAQCPCCGGSRLRFSCTSGSTFQMMHIVARCKGGASASWNLVPGCGCNQQQGQQNLLDWMGTRGNKRWRMRPLMLRKYKSLVPPLYRSQSRTQLIEWIQRLYAPERLDEYRDWLLLLDSDLTQIEQD